MRKVTLQEIVDGKLPKGSFIMVRWLDASDVRASLMEHETSPETMCKDWGLFLGISGRKHRLILLGKDVVEVHNHWGATRIPIDLVDEVFLILPREEITLAVCEVQTLGRRIMLRKIRRKEERYVVKTS